MPTQETAHIIRGTPGESYGKEEDTGCRDDQFIRLINLKTVLSK